MVILVGLAIFLHIQCFSRSATFLLGVLTAVGTCGAVLYAIYETIPKKELIKGSYSIDLYSNSVVLFLDNVGGADVLLAEDCVATMTSTDGKNTFYTNKLGHMAMLPKGVRRKEVIFKMDDKTYNSIKVIQATGTDFICYATTIKGTIITLGIEKSDTQ